MSESSQVRGQVSEVVEVKPEVLALKLSNQNSSTNDASHDTNSITESSTNNTYESENLNTELIFNKSGLFSSDYYASSRFIGDRYRHRISSVAQFNDYKKFRDGHLPNLKYLIGRCNFAVAPSKYISDESKLQEVITYYNNNKNFTEQNYKSIPFIKDVVDITNTRDNSLLEKPELLNYSLLTEASGIFVLTIKPVELENFPEKSALNAIINWMHEFDISDDLGCLGPKNNPLETLMQRTPSGNYQLIYRSEYAVECLRSFGDILYPKQTNSELTCGISLKYGKESVKLYGSYGKNGKKYTRIDSLCYRDKDIFTSDLPRPIPLWLLERIFKQLQNNNYEFINVDSSLIAKNPTSTAFKFNPIEGVSSNTKAIIKEILSSPYLDIKKCCDIIDESLFNRRDNCVRIISTIYNLCGKSEYNFDVTDRLIKKSPHYVDLMKKLVVPLYRSNIDIKKLSDYKSKFGLSMLVHFIKKSISRKYYNIVSKHLFRINGFTHRFHMYKYKDFHKYDYQNFEERVAIQDYIRNCIRKIDGNAGKILYYLNSRETNPNGEIIETIMINTEYDLMSKFKDVEILRAVKKVKISKKTKEEVIEYKNSNLWEVTKKFLANNSSCCYSDITFIPVSPLTKNSKYIINSLETLQRFNTFEGFLVEYDDKLKVDHKVIEPVLTQINYMCSGNKTHFDYFIKWLAHIVQEPHVKNDVIMHIRTAEEGSGKSTFFDWFGDNIIGKSYLRVNSMERITSEKNGLLGGKVLINIEEGEILANNFKVIDILKDLCTCKKTVIRKLYSEGVEVDSFSNFVVLTNRAGTIPLSIHDRRYFCLEFKKPFPTGHKYWGNLTEVVYKDPNVVKHFYNYLLSVNVCKNDLLTIPMTQAKADLVVIPSFVSVVNEYYQNYMREDAEDGCRSSALVMNMDEIVERLTEYERDNKGIQSKINRAKLGKEIKLYFTDVNSKEQRINGIKKMVYTFDKKCIELGLSKYPSIQIDYSDVNDLS